MHKDTFDILILIGRPAAGKSEVIDFLKKTEVAERRRRFHIDRFEEIDDFPYIWEKFEEDAIFVKHGKPRVFTDDQLYFKDPFIWNFFIEKINMAFQHKLRDNPDFLDEHTAIVEFARGGERGFAEAFGYLGDEIVKRAAILYIKVSYEESVRRNRKRHVKAQEHSILFHSLPDEKMDFYYKINDWETLTANDPHYITVRGHRVPYGVFSNQPEKTHDPVLLGEELEQALESAWSHYQVAVPARGE